MDELAGLIRQARERGVDVHANVYPYTRGNNDLASIVPPWAHEGGKEKLLANLRDPALRERLKRDIRQGLPGWYNHFTAIGGDWSRMLVSGRGTYQGLTMDRVLSLRKAGREGRIDDLDELFALLVDQGGSVPTVYAHHTEEDMRKAMVQPWCSIGSDGSALSIDGPLRRGNPHPRSFGTFPRMLGVYARREKVVSLEEAVRKMTSLNANKVNIVDRGVIAVGRFADLVVFDADSVIDRATYNEPFQYPEGISHVVVNGQLVLDDGRLTMARPGRALRGAGAN
jgi:N-acyl-D-aspartate/D-glutamate deacylase